jgi:peptidoglycan/LPS O-acetylase OafA/YrhL
LRIFPVYLLIIAILAATRYAPISFIVLSLLYLSNLTPLFGVAIAYPVLWSLAVEEHFYLFWPALVRNTRNLGLIISCVGVIILTPILRLMSYYIAARNGPVSFVVNDYTWNSLDGLACGALLAVSLRQFQPSRKTLWIVAASLLGIAILLIGGGIPLGITSRQGPFGMALQIVPFNFAFTALLCCFLLLGTSARKPIVLSKPLQELGRISYGLYLVHILIFDLYMHVIVFLWKGGADLSHLFRLLVRFVVCAGVSIGIAILSRDYFEERFLRLKDRLS